MPQQNYDSHIHYYPPYHFFFLPLIAALTAGSCWCAWSYPADRLMWIAFSVAFFMLGFFAFMTRQHYALGNQNRIVRLELRLRYFQLSGQRLEPLESGLSFGQLAALRFASDEEFLPLLERALNENLSPDSIKKSITNWLPDHMRL